MRRSVPEGWIPVEKGSKDKDKMEKIIKMMEEYEPLMFHPIYERDKIAWFPSNEAASIASLISHAWEDVCCLSKIRNGVKSEHEKRLIFKYVLVELKSVIDQLDRLQGIIFSIIKNDKLETVHGHISKTEAAQVKLLFKQYHVVKTRVESDLSAIRNRIGAHREVKSWNDIMELWDKLEPDQFKDLLVVLPKLFNYLVKLDIYDWTRIPEDGVIEICCSGLEPVYE